MGDTTESTPATPAAPVLTAEGMKSTLDSLLTAVNGLREYDEREEKETKEKGGPAPETVEAKRRLNDALDNFEALTEAFRADQVKRARGEQLPGDASPAGPSTVDMEEKDAAAYDVAINLYMRKGERALNREQEEILHKALSTDSNPDGGWAVQRTVDTNLRRKLIEYSPIRELADVQTISGTSWEGPAEGATDFEAGWVSERAPRPETGTGTIRMDRINVHELYANPHATQKMLDDANFNMEAWITEKLTSRFRVVEGLAFLSGDGNGKPVGILTRTDIPTVTSGGATTITADGLIKLIYDLPEFYSRDAYLIMKRSTIRDIRSIKDPTTSQYIWQPGLQVGLPATILEVPYRQDPYMPAIGAGNKAVIYGNLKIGYKIIDRKGMNTLRDPFTAKPFVGFYTTKRVGGDVVMAEALRTMTISA